MNIFYPVHEQNKQRAPQVQANGGEGILEEGGQPQQEEVRERTEDALRELTLFVIT